MIRRFRLESDDMASIASEDDSLRIAASIAMFERVSEHWSLRGSERETLLGGVPKSTWSEWRQRPKSARIKADTRERIANLLLVDFNAHALFAPEFADRWVREPNAALNGISPLAKMLAGKVEDVIAVRRYLDGVRVSAPLDSLRAHDGRDARAVAISFLPAAVAEPAADLVLRDLRRGLAAVEAMRLQEPDRYRRAYAAALGGLASWLEEMNDDEAVAVQRQAVDVWHRLGTDTAEHQVELLESLAHLRRLVLRFGKKAEARSISRELEQLRSALHFRDSA